MIGLDTNVLVRYCVREDPQQTAIAIRAIETQCTKASPGFISHLVLCELVWVLESRYNQSREQVATVLEKLLKTSQLRVDDLQLVWQAFIDYRKNNNDFADAIIGRYHRKHGCTTTLTFDKKASRLAGFTALR